MNRADLAELVENFADGALPTAATASQDHM
jgi:hypothetical protein